MLESSSPVRKICWFAEEFDKKPSHRQFTLTFTTPDRIRLTIDGEPRPVYRCYAVASEIDGVRPVCWRSKTLGFAGDEKLYPVYMQSHAAEQWQRRLATPFASYFWLCRSFVNPSCISLRGNAFLVAYRFLDKLLGYFACERVGDLILIRTFLFLTMAGTPEADRLRELLHLRRPDIEVNRLDRIETYLGSDVGQDPVLKSLFTECGCGHLFELARWFALRTPPRDTPSAYANTLA